MYSRARILVVIAVALATVPVRADEWKKTFTSVGQPEIRINTNDASIEVRASDRKDTEIQVFTQGYQIGENKVRVTDHQNGDVIDVEVYRHSQTGLHISFHEASIRIEISVPREANLDLHSGDGHIRVDDVKGSMRMDSNDGHIEANHVDGKLHAHSSDGHITVDGRFDDLDLHTNDGNVDAVVRPGSNMNNSWSIHTGDGSVILNLPDTLKTNLDLHTGDGRVTLDIPVTVSGKISPSDMHGILNGGGFALVVRTGDGNIQIGKV